ncbi:hypothetical protein ABH922_005795 [Rhodococcus sp. 27YEA15]
MSPMRGKTGLECTITVHSRPVCHSPALPLSYSPMKMVELTGFEPAT